MNVHLCGFSDYPDVQHEFEGRVCRFDFSERFGPLFLRKDGEPMLRQPLDGWRWRAFTDWHEEFKAG